MSKSTVDQKVCGSCHRTYKEDKDFLENTSQWRVCSSENLWFNCSCGSTLMLPKGKFPWYSPAMTMSEGAASLFNRMARMQDLPHIPAAVMEIQEMLANPEIEIATLAKTVRKDPLLATEVIRVADNLRKIRQGSAPSTNHSIEYAIAFIGRKHLGNLVMAASIKNFALPTKDFNQDQFWDAAFTTAAIAELIAVRFCKDIEKDKAYLAGCLCNIGKIVGALYFPEKTDAVVRKLADVNTQTTWPKVEKLLDMPSHCILGEIGAAFWGLAPFVIEAVKNHHAPNSDESDHLVAVLCHIASLANSVFHWLNLEPHRIDEDQLKRELAYFSLNEKGLETFVEEIRKTLEAPQHVLK